MIFTNISVVVILNMILKIQVQSANELQGFIVVSFRIKWGNVAVPKIELFFQ